MSIECFQGFPSAESVVRDSGRQVFINVVGGTKNTPAEFPHMAALGWQSSKSDGNTNNTTAPTFDWKCGGTLISDRYVLTAAHCVKRSPQPVVVRLGQHDLRVRNSQSDHSIAAIHKHPEYRTQRAYNDIALIRLAARVPFSDRQRPACLWTVSAEGETPPEMLATGFGLTEYGENSVVRL